MTMPKKDERSPTLRRNRTKEKLLKCPVPRRLSHPSMLENPFRASAKRRLSGSGSSRGISMGRSTTER